MIEELNNMALTLKQSILDLLPSIIMALAVLIVGYLVARLIKFLVVRFVKYLGKLISLRYAHVNVDRSAKVMGTALFWFALLVTFLFIADILRLTIILGGIESIVKYIPNILAALLILLAGNVIGKLISDLIQTVSARVGFPYGNTVGRIAQVLIILTTIIIVIDQIGIEVTFLINLISIVLAALLFGAALAFAIGARTSISNILAAFYVRKHYKEGDYIKIGDAEGRIVKIDSTCVILDVEDGQYIIPAKDFNDSRSQLIRNK